MAFDFSRIRSYLVNSGIQSAKKGEQVRFNALYQAIFGLITGAEEFSSDILDINASLENLNPASNTVEDIDGTNDPGSALTYSRGDHKHGIVNDTVTEAMLNTADNTTKDVTSTKHGFAPKSPADATKFLNGAATPAFAVVKDSDLSTSDITTNDVSITKHGFAPKAPNDSAKYLDGTGAYSKPSGTGGAGDVSGPASAVSDNAAVFDGTSGKLIKDGGPRGLVPLTIDADTILTAGKGWVIPESLEINAGKILEIGAGSLCEITGSTRGISGCRLKKLTTQSIADSSYVPLTWDFEEYDYGGYFNAASDNINIVIPETGMYTLTFSGSFAASGGGSVKRYLICLGPLTSGTALPSQVLVFTGGFPTGTTEFGMVGITILLFKGQSICAVVNQNSGNPVNMPSTAGGNLSTTFSISRAG